MFLYKQDRYFGNINFLRNENETKKPLQMLSERVYLSRDDRIFPKGSLWGNRGAPLRNNNALIVIKKMPYWPSD
jgi:hypothetical protein